MTAMKLEQAKKKFIRLMDDIHSNIMYPKFYFGCLMAIVSENEPVTQDRIMELTGYSRGYVSLTLKQLQMNLPIRTIKKPGNRMKFFTYGGRPVSYLLDLLSTRIMRPDFNPSPLSGIAVDLERLKKRDDNAKRFSDFVRNLIAHDEIQREVREVALSELGKAFDVGSFPTKVLSYKLPIRVESYFSPNDTKKPDSSRNDNPHGNHSVEYLQLKDEYFQSLRETFNPHLRASVNNYSLVLHEVLIEECSTQDSIEVSTKLPQSTISEFLNQLIGQGYITKKRVRGQRKVYYYPTASLTSLILFRFDRTDMYTSNVLTILEDVLRLVNKSNEERVQEFYSILEGIRKGYLLLQQYSDRMRNIAKEKIFDRHQEGFTFI